MNLDGAMEVAADVEMEVAKQGIVEPGLQRLRQPPRQNFGLRLLYCLAGVSGSDAVARLAL